MSEETAYHEAGHAYLAVRMGAQVRSVTIAPDRDDGPQRYGDAQIAWDTKRLNQAEFIKRASLVALAGPVAEMLYLGDEMDLRSYSPWLVDWKMADDLWRAILTDRQKRERFLLQMIDELKSDFEREANWAAIAAIADELLAHEWLEHDSIADIVDYWGNV